MTRTCSILADFMGVAGTSKGFAGSVTPFTTERADDCWGASMCWGTIHFTQNGGCSVRYLGFVGSVLNNTSFTPKYFAASRPQLPL